MIINLGSIARLAVPKLVCHQSSRQLHGPLIMAKVSSDRYQKVVKCGAPKHRFNDFILMHIREGYDVQALDANHICQPGDWVLLRQRDDLPDKSVTHEVEKVVYSAGHYICPITNKRSLGLYYDDDMKKLERIKVEL